MGYGLIAVLIVLVAGLFFAAAFWLLANRKWIAGFIRGFAGFTALLLALALLLVAQDLSGFTSLKPGQVVLTVSARETTPDHYAIELNEANGEQVTVNIEGDQWVLDVRMFHWTPILKALGFRTGYQLDRIRGRYLFLNKQQESKDQGTVLHDVGHIVDVWAQVKDGAPVPGLSAALVSPGFIRVANGAIYEVTLSGTNLEVAAVNDAAKAALSAW